jgi:hypothetical protein
MQKRFFVTSLFSRERIKKAIAEGVRDKVSPQALKGFSRMNAERKSVFRLLASKGKRIILFASKTAPQTERDSIRRFVESVKQKTNNRRIRIKWVDDSSYYAAPWMRDTSVRLGKRILSRIRAEDWNIRSQKEKRFFGDGGRIIRAGIKDGKEVLLVSSSEERGTRHGFAMGNRLAEETNMLRRRGFIVFELPGFEYRALGRAHGETAKPAFFHHIDVFVNTIPDKKVLLVDHDYNKAHASKVREAADFLGYSTVVVPAEERFVYPANFLNIGNGEIIMDKAAPKTARLLRELGVTVYTTPQELKGNGQLFGGVRCFVNED